MQFWTFPTMVAPSLPHNDLVEGLIGTLPNLSGLTGILRVGLYGNGSSLLKPGSQHTGGLSGTIPSLTALTTLQQFNVQTATQGKISGSIPDLSACTALTVLFCGNLQLSGTLPELSALTNLIFFGSDRNGVHLLNPAHVLQPLSLAQYRTSVP